MGKKLLFLGFILGLSSQLWSQSYPENKEKFVKYFEKALGEYGPGEYQNFAKNDFPVLLLESGKFPEDYFTRMVATCNLMEQKRLDLYPDIYNYIYSVSALIIGEQSKESYEAWHSSVDKLLSIRNVKRFTDFIATSASFFSESKINESSNFMWYYFGGDYKFEYTDKAYVRFSGGNLVCRVPNKRKGQGGEILDSLVIINTTGVYDPILKKWVGTGGKVTWEKVGMDPSKTFAVLNYYDLSLKNSTVRVDTVALTTPYFDQPLAGSLTERAFTVNRDEVDRVYPQFLSFEKDLVIEELVKNVDYVGGFALNGSTFVGAGTSKQLAEITYKRDGAPFMRVRAEQIDVSPKKIFVVGAQYKMNFPSGDSLTHPGINFTYDLEKENITLDRTRTGRGQAPFSDSYHELEIYVPKIIWNIGSDDIEFTYEFGTSQEQRVASFESTNYFNEQVYDRLQGLSANHPLSQINDYCYKYDEYILTEGKAATALGMTVEQAKHMLLQLSNMGFISYDTDQKIVVVNKKLQTFVRAKAGKQDYDNIVFTTDMRPKELKGYTDDQIKKDPYLSSIKELYDKQNKERQYMKNFGVLNLSTMDLELSAVDNVVISQTRNTVVFPDNAEVKVKKNRDFNFKGWINAGKLEINTDAANFNYSKYDIKILSSKEALFRVRPLRKEDGPKPIPMVSSLSGIAGNIVIDDSTNRSGNKKGFDDYPKLNSTQATRIFYNSKDIFHGAYDSTRFYYTVEPFLRDSLNSFNERALRLKGELTSAGIFPKINEPVKIMPDYSFGFVTKSTEGGMDFYGGDAKYDNKIVLSHNGLQGSGTINYIHSTSISKAWNFLPDSTIGYAQFENKPIETGVEFPDVIGDETYVSYLPKQKRLKSMSLPKKDMIFFGGEAKMHGTAVVQPTGMIGNGIMTFITATVESDRFEYKRHEINADTSAFNLKNESQEEGEDPLAFKTDNVKAHISFKERKGVFNSNEGESTVEFPINQYMCKMDQFTWLMDELSIEMQKKKEREISIDQGVDLVGPNFFSTNPKQDSLQFRAPKAKFDLKGKTIYCDEVEYVDIADARIYPDSMKLTIRKKAKMDKLQNAEIVASYVTKYHKFTEAEVEIKGRRDYEAKGKYPYYDKDSTVEYIAMNDIGLDTSYQTRASGKIDAERGFKLSPEFDYYGDVSIRASNPLIYFSGATRINHGCAKFDRNWMAFTSQIDPKNIQIPVSDQMKDLDGNPISAGIVWRDSRSTDSLRMYPTFLSALYDANDPIVITSSGLLQYDPSAKEYQIASKDKLVDKSEPGNYIALNTETCSMSGEGVINLGMDYGDMTVDAVGEVNYDQSSGETTMDITARFDMPVDKGLFQDVANRINEVPNLQPMESNWPQTTTLEKAVLEWDGRKESDKIVDEYVRKGEVKSIPEGLQKSMTVTGIHLKSFDHPKFQEKGLVTTLSSASLVSMYGKPVFKQVQFSAFFLQSHSQSDAFMLDISVPGGNNYFYHYQMEKKDGTLRIQTIDSEFKAAIDEMKPEKRKKKNFKYETTTNGVYYAKFMEIFSAGQ